MVEYIEGDRVNIISIEFECKLKQNALGNIYLCALKNGGSYKDLFITALFLVKLYLQFRIQVSKHPRKLY